MRLRPGHSRRRAKPETFERRLDEKDVDQLVATFAGRGRRMLGGREMRDAGRVWRKRITSDDRRVRGGALPPVLFGRAERGGRRHLARAPRATFKTRMPALAGSRCRLRVALRLCRPRAIHPRRRAVGLRFRRKRVFVRRCCMRVFCRFRMRRVRLAEFGAATVVLVRRRRGGSQRARVVQAARGDGSQRARPHARRERQKQAEDESRSSHKLVELFAAYIQPYRLSSI